MVDFKKRLGGKNPEKKLHPVEIYNSLDRRSDTGPLRPAQEAILNDWYENRKTEKNNIIKLHTGEGKTLIGLLILTSKLNSNEGPCLYICPNIYLVNQTIEEAKRFGIPFCTFGEDKDIPDEFTNKEAILITHVQKVFNGRSKFGVGPKGVEIGSLVMDDSHACIDSIRQAFSITITRSNKEEKDIYEKLLNLFEEDLKSQGEGSYLDIKEQNYDTIQPIPYWSWNEKRTEVLNILRDNIQNDAIGFTWPLLKDNIINQMAIFSGNQLEISPYHAPIHLFSSFNQAKHRILMSATTQDDAFFIKGFDFDTNTIKNPLSYNKQVWSGEKMILLSSMIDEKLDRDEIVDFFSKQKNNKFGIVSLVPRFKQSMDYQKNGAILANATNIFEIVNNLKMKKFESTIVIANRYDGIDLPDEACRILILDLKPVFNSLTDRYEEECRPLSDITNVKIAQKIEQGLGRSVRGEKDYSAIVITGGDLIKFLRSTLTNKYFSAQTRRQIEIGLEIAQMAREEGKTSGTAISGLTELINQCLKRDKYWIQYYTEEMDKITHEYQDNNILDCITLETKAEYQNFLSNHEKACEIIQELIDKFITNSKDKGWYLQQMARYKYNISKLESEKLQKAAFELNYNLIKPVSGITYKKVNFASASRIKRIKDWVQTHSSFEEMMINLQGIMTNLTFGSDSEKFESALQEVGDALGFISQRPDKEIRKGPDNLWCGVGDKYIFFECKTQVLESRPEINKHEAAQMNSHSAWFESQYKSAIVKRIMISPTKDLSYHGDFTHEVSIMRKSKLRELKANIISLFKEFKPYDLKDITDEKVNEFVYAHKLDVDNLYQLYSEPYYHKSS